MSFVDNDPEYSSTKIKNIPVIIGLNKLTALVQSLEVDEIILAKDFSQTTEASVFDELLRCRELGLRLTSMPILYERLLGRVPIDHIGQQDLYMVLPMEEVPTARIYKTIKRGLEILVACLGILVMCLFIPFIFLINAFTSPGPLFYRQLRVGLGGKTFEMLKFRSMDPKAEQLTGAVWASKSDERITPVGRFIRRTRIDEIPQFINILKGDMSLIGPRPERPEFVETLANDVPFYRARHAVLPGITGWAQLEYHYGNSFLDAKVKLEYDLYYVRHISPLLDLRIILQTIPLMIGLAGV